MKTVNLMSILAIACLTSTAAHAAVNCELESVNEVYGPGSLPSQFTLSAESNNRVSANGTFYSVGPEIDGVRVGYAKNPKIAAAQYWCTGEL